MTKKILTILLLFIISVNLIGCAGSSYDAYLARNAEIDRENQALLLKHFETQQEVNTIALADASKDTKVIMALLINQNNEKLVQMAMNRKIEKPKTGWDIVIALSPSIINGALAYFGFQAITDVVKAGYKASGDNFNLTNSNQNDIGNSPIINGNNNGISSGIGPKTAMPPMEHEVEMFVEE